MAPLHLLIVEDDRDYATLLGRILVDTCGLDSEIRKATRLSEALAELAAFPPDLVLLDLGLPDSQGLATVLTIRTEAPDVPVLVVTSLPDEAIAVNALQAGAQDYLIKDEIDSRSLSRAIRYALERHRLQRQLLSLTLTDELTGLYNRRGFFTLAERHLRLSRRRSQGVLMVLADVDHLKQINDSFGHPEGDRALVTIAQILGATFRDVDIVSRLGGDEFAVLVVDADREIGETLAARLERRIGAHNASSDLRYPLSISIGMARQKLSSQRKGPTLEELIGRADEQLYKRKRARPAIA